MLRSFSVWKKLELLEMNIFGRGGKNVACVICIVRTFFWFDTNDIVILFTVFPDKEHVQGGKVQETKECLGIPVDSNCVEIFK